MDWYRTNPGDVRHTRALTAIQRAGVEALLALSPENAAYLANQSNYIATHWRLPGLFAVAIGKNGRTSIDIKVVIIALSW